MKQIIQVDFHPNGKIIKIYEGGGKAAIQVDTRHKTPRELLNERLKIFKKSKLEEK